MMDPMAPIRAEVMAQPEHERADYALDLLAYYLEPVPAFFEGCRRLGLGLDPAEIKMLAALDARRGRYVSINGLLSARSLGVTPDDWPPTTRVVRGICIIRRRLKLLRLPVTITTWRDVGYCLEAPADFRFEDAAEVAQAGAA